MRPSLASIFQRCEIDGVKTSSLTIQGTTIDTRLYCLPFFAMCCLEAVAPAFCICFCGLPDLSPCRGSTSGTNREVRVKRCFSRLGKAQIVISAVILILAIVTLSLAFPLKFLDIPSIFWALSVLAPIFGILAGIIGCIILRDENEGGDGRGCLTFHLVVCALTILACSFAVVIAWICVEKAWMIYWNPDPPYFAKADKVQLTRGGWWQKHTNQQKVWRLALAILIESIAIILLAVLNGKLWEM